ncbi:hypothetical protein AMATHDRAFT_11528 [Amanita thiersii Skay4041]|uniref:Uncharacterized protein n=1 Tax=Amanita thiersii Skay4041 TaxID=703135 RepID=A0A2A9N6E1_9AGAR|nr:hypothetical protein AMATHDRAFT_11528 [Amanita thiersii Skay4041]
MYYWSDDIRRIIAACEQLDGFARINFLALHIRHRYFVWVAGGEPLLNHYGWTLSAEERNRFMHTLNGNIEPIHERILLVREFHEAILYIMESLQGQPQVTIDSFFEYMESTFQTKKEIYSSIPYKRLSSPGKKEIAPCMLSTAIVTFGRLGVNLKKEKSKKKEPSSPILDSFNG